MESIVIFVFGFHNSSKLRQLRQFWIFDSTVHKVVPDFFCRWKLDFGIRPFPSCFNPPCQSEAKCEATDAKMNFYSPVN